jgi:hypothetical protein
MCDHCFNASDFQLPSGVRVCRDCFYESYCACCWEPVTQVGETNEESFCATCINNNLPPNHNDNDNIIYNNDINIIYNDIIINPMDTDEDSDEEYVLGPPEGFDMNAASVVEHNPEYADNLTNSQVEYECNWYFALNGQIYSVPYEIEIDDYFVRQDIVSHWDDVRWVGSIFGEYIAWL